MAQTKIQQQYALHHLRFHETLLGYHVSKDDCLAASAAFIGFLEKLPPSAPIVAIYVDDIFGRIRTWATLQEPIVQNLIAYVQAPPWEKHFAAYSKTPKHYIPGFSQFAWQRESPSPSDLMDAGTIKTETERVLKETKQQFSAALDLDERGICRKSKHQTQLFVDVVCGYCKKSGGMLFDQQTRSSDEGAAQKYTCPNCNKVSTISNGR